MSSSTFGGIGVAVTPGTVAPIGGRVLAFLVDGFVVGAAYGLGLGIVAALGHPGYAVLIPALLAVLVGIGQWVAESFTGATVGGAVLGYRTVAVDDGRPAGLLAILVRQLVVAAGSLACGVGQLVVVASGAWDDGPAQRGWHDKAARTLVLRASALKPRRPGGTGAWNQAVERAVGSPPAQPSPAASRPLPVVPPMPPLAPATAPPVARFALANADAEAEPAAEDVGSPAHAGGSPQPAATALPPAGEPSQAVRPASVAEREQPDQPKQQATAPARPRGGPVASAYLERLAAAEAHTDDSPVLDETRAAAARAQEPPARAQDQPPAPAPLITGYPGQPSTAVPPVPRTQDLGELEYTRMRESVPTDRAGVLRLTFDTGQRIDVTGDGLVGRSPEGEMGIVHVVVIDDPQRSVSKVHLAFGLTPAGDELWVVDRASVNGTVLVDPDGVAATLPAGTRALVGAGWTIRFGQRSAKVERR
ncbi:RDD family protein [Cellulomonas edaphi]|uniref:RDD family protein n=1 Tax=Cellulomonas edaphi TaxID=3053468 RepID=A0ABT7SB79_9CELL|nr:RDD family protein [Cellulomons edaphi]MDM7832204.1 RDD family protein [Cellulomons edaphi]